MESGKEWLVSMPLSDAVRMQESLKDIQSLKDANFQLRRELEALRRMYFEIVEKLADSKGKA